MNLPSKQVPHTSELGRYQVVASLGQGGMANVYLALMSGPVGFNKLLVIKVLRDDVDASADEMMGMFMDEARLAARLNHRCIVQTYEVGEVDGRCLIAMEYLDGQPLRGVQRKLRPGRLPVEEELRILAETAHGLHYAHDLTGLDGKPLNVVHRDVSPQNVFLTYDGQVKLLDFGIAKTNSSEHETRVGVIKGKMDYIAPEQLRGDEIDRRADVFALGVMLWECLTGKRFAGGPKVPDPAKITRRLTGGELKIRDVNPSVPEPLAKLVDEAIALDPKQRLATAAEFATRIESYLGKSSRRVSEKTLAALLTARFEEERANMRQVIETRTQELRARGRGRHLDSLQTSALRPLDLGMTSSQYLDLSQPSSAQSLLSISQPLPLPEPAPTAKPRLGLALAATGLLFAAVGLTAFLNRTPPIVAAPGATATATASVEQQPVTDARPLARAPADAAATVTLTISAAQRDAHAKLDGAPLGPLPFTGSFPAGGAMHHLEISADGYQTVRKMVSFEQDRAVQVSLEPVRTQPARVARRVVSAGSAAREPVAAVAPKAEAPQRAEPAQGADESAPGEKLRSQPKSRRIDSHDPYES